MLEEFVDEGFSIKYDRHTGECIFVRTVSSISNDWADQKIDEECDTIEIFADAFGQYYVRFDMESRPSISFRLIDLVDRFIKRLKEKDELDRQE